MTTTIANFYKFVENIDGNYWNFYFQNNVLNFLNRYGKKKKFDAEKLEQVFHILTSPT